jgi:type IV secretion system protein VirB4
LEKWIWGNELGWVADAPIDTVRFGDLTGLDVTALLENPRARGPSLLYLFHRISLLLDGTPLLITVDEGWRAGEDPVFQPAIMKAIRTIRSKEGMLIFITQSPGDAARSGMKHVLIDMCPTQFHLANPRGRREEYVGDTGIGLTDGQFDALKQLQPGQGMFLLIQGEESGLAQLPMGKSMKPWIELLSAREADLRASDRETEQKELEEV